MRALSKLIGRAAFNYVHEPLEFQKSIPTKSLDLEGCKQFPRLFESVPMALSQCEL